MALMDTTTTDRPAASIYERYDDAVAENERLRTEVRTLRIELETERQRGRKALAVRSESFRRSAA
jgi:hypothetical protein